MVTSVVREAPVGVFDSGIGGLTVVSEMLSQLPLEGIIYVGDTARVPYGPKSPDTVRRYAREIAFYLAGQHVKAIVIACNTATAHALDMLRAELSVPVVGVVQPGARAAAAATISGRIGVIGTTGTVRSGAYERAIRSLRADATVVSLACPLFVPLVEEGWTDHAAARLIATEYLRPLLDVGIDTLVMGCTHYPLLKPLLADTLGPSVRLIDSAQETAAEVGRVLRGANLDATSAENPVRRFLATDDPDQMLRLGQRFLGRTIERVETLALE